MSEPPIRLTVADDLVRSRLTVFFRALLAIPHIVWLLLWGFVAFLAAILNWLATLFNGISPAALHRFLAAYVRYATHVAAYLCLAANPFPGFTGRAGSYPIDVEIDPPRRQSRWITGFRLILALPAVLLAGALVGSSGGRGAGINYSLGLLPMVAVLGWFAALFTARMPRGLRDAASWALSYSAQLDGYLLLLTDRYPSADPLAALRGARGPAHPVDVAIADDLVRSRLTVFFRLLLAIPHLVWLAVWSVVALLAAIVSWFATLFNGVSPAALHRFLAAYVRYRVHVLAYLHLIANPFPGFAGRIGSYPIDVAVAAPARQNRWKTGFRWLLFWPALLIGSAYTSVLLVAALLGWFAALFTARMPRGLRNAGAFALRYDAQFYSYALLLTDRYPYSGPTELGSHGAVRPLPDAPVWPDSGETAPPDLVA